jgi:hypothetical protein
MEAKSLTSDHTLEPMKAGDVIWSKSEEFSLNPGTQMSRAEDECQRGVELAFLSLSVLFMP